LNYAGLHIRNKTHVKLLAPSVLFQVLKESIPAVEIVQAKVTNSFSNFLPYWMADLMFGVNVCRQLLLRLVASIANGAWK
jgi:hypothetical protein